MAENIEVAELLVKLRADTAEFNAQIRQVTGQQSELKTAIDATQASGTRLGAAFQALGGFAGMAAASGGAALLGFLQSSVREYMEAEQAAAKLNAVLTATGGVAGVTSQQILDYSSRMQGLTGVQDELIQSAASVLLTFRSLRGDAFERTMTAAMDLSAVFGTSLQGSVTMLGKALENPISGMTALRRVGISFSDAEKEVIKDLVKHNQLAEAQGKILAIVEAQVQGTATALGQTIAGQIRVANAAWGDFKEMVGKVTVETLNLTWWAKALADAIKKENEAIGAGVSTQKLSAEQLKANIAQFSQLAAGYRQMAEQHKGNTALVKENLEKWQDWTQQARDAERQLAALEAEQGRAKVVQDEHTDSTKVSAATLREFKEEAKDAADRVADLGVAFEASMREMASPERFIADWTTGFGQLGRAAADPFATTFSTELGAQLGLQSTRTDAFGLASALGTSMSSEAVSYSITRPTSTAIKLGVQEGLTEGPQIPSNVAWMREYSEQLQATLEDSLFRGLRGGLEALFRGDDFTNAWEAMWDDLAAIAATSMAGTIKQGLFGGSGPLGDNVRGLFGGTGTAMTTSQKWQLGGQLVGAGLMYYGQQNQDSTTGTAGGAISGAVSGFQMTGNWIGAVVGAVVGGYMGWKGAQSKSTDYHVWGGPGGYQTDVTGYGNSEEAEMARTIWGKAMGYRKGIRSLGRSLDLGNLSVQIPTIDTHGSAGNFNDWFNAFVSGTLPRSMFGQVGGLVLQGLKDQGVSQTRATSLLSGFETGNFDQALQELQQFVNALTGLKDVSDLLGMTPEQLRKHVNMSLREGFLAGFDDTMDSVSDLMDGVEGLFSQEQVDNAEQLIGLAQTQYEAGLQYFSQLEQLRKSIGTSFEDIFMGFEQKKAAAAGTESQWLDTTLQNLMAQLQGATSSEQVSRIISQLQSYGGQAWDLYQEGANASGMASVEEILREAQRISEEKILAWEEEVAAKNAELQGQIDAMTAALQGSTVAIDGSRPALDGLATSATLASGAVDTLGASSTLAAAQLAGLAGAIAEASARMAPSSNLAGWN